MSARTELAVIIAEARQKAVDAHWASQKTCTLGQAGRVAQKCAEIGDQAAADAVLAAGWGHPDEVRSLRERYADEQSDALNTAINNQEGPY